jgi:hypothetical protein
VAISDVQFRAGVVGAATLLVVGITLVRFCGSVSLPAKSTATATRTSGGNYAEQSNNSAPIYQDYLAKDASIANVATPSLEDMSRKLPYSVDERRRVLEVGQAPIEVAGLRVSAHKQGDTLVLAILNTTESTFAYHVVSEPTPKIAGCNSVDALPLNAIVIAKGERQVRAECGWRQGMAIAVTRIETVELSPLSAWYLNQVPPEQVGIEDRVGRGHRVPQNAPKCISLSSTAILNGIENGEIQWRDLVDFYARHRCQTYPFRETYRALTSDGQRRIPAT